MDQGSSSTSGWEYLDFEIEVREGGPRHYPICVLHSPAGEAREQMEFPFDQWELKDRLQALEIALLRSGGSRRRIRLPEEQTIEDFGRSLFEALLPGEVRTRYAMSLREARRQNKGLRLKLRIQPPELAHLPWEFLYDSAQDEYLCLSSKTPLVRYLDLPEPLEQLSVTPPLRILGMVASPLGLEQLNVGHEKRLLEEAIKDLRADRLLELTWLEGQTWSDLHRAMRSGPWHIFHFIGHGGFDPSTEEGAIALADETGHKHLLRARNLARLLNRHYPLRLVFLNSCEGAKGSESDAFSSTAATLVRRGVPTVLAMQYEVTDEAAIDFSRAFYQAVADGLPVDAAVADARTAVSMTINNTLEWGTPVLYMHSADGRIFDISAQAPPPEDRQHRSRLEDLYKQARRSYRAQEWQTVVDTFEQIHEVDPEYPDPEGLLISAREGLAAHRQAPRAALIYQQGLSHMEADEWQEALQCFEELQQLEPGYRQTEALLEQVRGRYELLTAGGDKVQPPVSEEVPDHSDQKASQASSTLQNRVVQNVISLLVGLIVIIVLIYILATLL